MPDCTHSVEERLALAADPSFCPACLFAEINRMIALNRELTVMLQQQMPEEEKPQ